jgi:hypothetical protein
MFVGFLVGGLALPLGPNWILFWAGVAIVVVGGAIALLVDIMSDVILAQPYVSRDPAKRAADARAARAINTAQSHR